MTHIHRRPREIECVETHEGRTKYECYGIMRRRQITGIVRVFWWKIKWGRNFTKNIANCRKFPFVKLKDNNVNMLIVCSPKWGCCWANKDLWIETICS